MTAPRSIPLTQIFVVKIRLTCENAQPLTEAEVKHACELFEQAIHHVGGSRLKPFGSVELQPQVLSVEEGKGTSR